MDEQDSTQSEEWFYEEDGARKGPIHSSQLEKLITSKKLTYGSLVWCKKFTNWQPLENTDFAEMLKSLTPPPLVGSAVKNTIVWILAFAPLIGTILEFVIAGALWGEYAGKRKAMNGELWFVTLLLNILLSVLDEKQLAKAGCDTNKFKGFVWLVPVYLYQRSEALKQSKAYFIAWIVSFILILFLF